MFKIDALEGSGSKGTLIATSLFGEVHSCRRELILVGKGMPLSFCRGEEQRTDTSAAY